MPPYRIDPSKEHLWNSPFARTQSMITTVYDTQEEFDQALDYLWNREAPGPNCRILPLLRAIVEMPPKVAPGKTLSNDAFLAACIKHAKDKLVVDFDSLAKEMGMSKGGASNKYRAIMKTLEEDGAAWAKPTTTNCSTAPKVKVNKRNASAAAAAAAADGDVAEDDGEEPPVKKPKAAAKKDDAKAVKTEKKPATGKAKKVAATKKETSDDEGDIDMDDGMTNAGSIPSPTLSEAEGASGGEET